MLDINVLAPSLTVAAPLTGARYGDMDNARSETWDDLGRLWGAWVWRTTPMKAATAEGGGSKCGEGQIMLGQLWQLPESDSEAGLAELKRLVQEDEEAKGAEAASSTSQKADQARALTAEMQTYYSQQTIQRLKDVSAPPPKVVLVYRGERELTVGWANPLKVESVVEVLVLVRPMNNVMVAARQQRRRTVEVTQEAATAAEEDQNAGTGEHAHAGDQVVLVATPWGAKSAGDAVLGSSSPRNIAQALRDRHPLMGGVCASTAATAGARDASTLGGVRCPPKAAVSEWREIYRGPKNGCRVSRLKPCW